MPTEPPTQAYVGTKIIRARPMSDREFALSIKGDPWPNNQPERPGYLVVYPDGYQSWSPEATFEDAYRPVTSAEHALVHGAPLP